MSDQRTRYARKRSRGRRLTTHVALAAAVGGVLLAAFGAVSGLAADKSVEATGNSLATYAWTPTATSIASGGTVEFKNMNTTVPHGVAFEATTTAPSCTGVPGIGGATSWSGTCTFNEAGVYNFHCTVHPSMTGTITVTGGPSRPAVTTEPASAINGTEATLSGKVNPEGEATTYFFEYGKTTAYGSETTPDSAGSGSAGVSKSATISGLEPETTYHFNLVAENATGESTGVDRTFTTAGKPTATTEAATGIGGVEATLAAQVNPRGLATTYLFNYGISDTYGSKTTEKTAGTGTAAVAKTELVSGLAPETTYHFQIVAENAAGVAKGLDKTFKTLGAPLATTGTATAITKETATLQGTVNPQGQQTTYVFEYGTTDTYGQETESKAAGKGLTSVAAAAALAGLQPETTYHFRLVAENASGSTPGADHTLLTGSGTEPPPHEEEKPPVEEHGPPPPPPVEEPAPPDTKITSKPPAKTPDRTPTIKFRATVGGATFQCSVDSKPFKACRSPFTAPSLKPGKHRVRVRAVASGVGDRSPASVSFKVVAPRKKR